ncbi:DUF3817 domain-containing protein [Sphingobacteriaceae bacterium WQ 2009]|uniref:DUF3817 domain-containing protein n=1 Tax=Rhinopithecimicrobium faecis TaxID=2820698 RepID=A0A8T4H861_9SPHI|nr:DUF3817 domain-containing protein [Sphingobacteriaceae bacterium WQ 2009]
MLRIFRQIALWEGISTVLLFCLAMPLKYFADIPDAVKIAGSIHGFLFIIYVIALLICWSEYKWEMKRGLIYLAASFVPFMPFWVEKDLKKK